MSTFQPGAFFRWTQIVGLNDGAWTKTPPLFLDNDFAARDRLHSWFFCFPIYKNVETLRFYFLGDIALFRSFVSIASPIPDISYDKPSTEEFYDAAQTIYPIDLEHAAFFHDNASLNSIIIACDKDGRLWTHGQYVKLNSNEVYSNPLGTGGIPLHDPNLTFSESSIDETPEVDRRAVYNATLNTGYIKFPETGDSGEPLQAARIIKTGIGPAAVGLMSSALTDDGRIFVCGFPSYNLPTVLGNPAPALVRQVFFRDCSQTGINTVIDQFPHVSGGNSSNIVRITNVVRDYSHGASMLLIDEDDELYWLGVTDWSGATVNRRLNTPRKMTGFVDSVTLTGGGSGYTSSPVITVTQSPLGSGFNLRLEATVSGGVVTALRITDPGLGYTSPPTITFNAPNPGTAASATCTLISATQKWSRVSVSQRGQHWCAITDGGVLYNWGGYAISNKPGATEFEECLNPRKVDTPALSDVFVGFGGSSVTFPNGVAIGTDGTAYTWGPAAVSGTGNIHYLPTAISGGPYIHAGSGGAYVLLVGDDGKLYGIGSGASVGGLSATTPTEIVSQATWTKVFCGQDGSVLARDETPEQYAARIHQ